MTTTQRPSKEEMLRRAKPAAPEKLIGGGVYIYRTRKPGSLLGLLWSHIGYPAWWMWLTATACACAMNYVLNGMWWFGLAILLCTGRHFAYVGETLTFEKRHAEHMKGGGRWKRGAASWSDLDAECVLRLRLPGYKWILRTVETLSILFLQPVYNDQKNRANLRRIPRASAMRMRKRREKRRVPMNFNFRPIHFIGLLVLVMITKMGGLW